MKLTLPHWLREPLPSWQRRERAPQPAPPGELTGVLRTFRTAALWAIGFLTATADGAAFTESYRGLLDWAEHHGLSGFWAAAFPAQVDTFIVIGEMALFVAMVGHWEWRDRLAAWAVALLGLAVSIAGNVGHVAAHDLQTRGTAAVPPVAAFGALWLGLGVLKRVLKYHRIATAGGAGTASGVALEGVAAGHLAEVLGGLGDAVRALADRPAAAVPAAEEGADRTALLGALLDAVRDVGARISGVDSVPVPSGAEHAALIAYRATLKAGNPHSMNALQARFGLTRSQAAKVRAAISDEHGGQVPADINGYQFDPAAGARIGSTP
jgi:hypothetical protein